MNLKILILSLAFLPLVFASCGLAQEKKPQAANMIIISPSPPDQSRMDEFKNLLFADQTLEESASRFKLEKTPAEDDIAHYFALALDNARKGKRDEAKKNLKYILNIPKAEVRWQLWAWKALRHLGEKPAAKEAHEVRGVVIEVPVQGGYDTLAVYSDGSLRYINYTGAILIWDTPDDSRFNSEIKNILASAKSFPNSKTPALEKHKPVKPDFAQISILTFNGIYQIEAKYEEVNDYHPFNPFIYNGARIIIGLAELDNKIPNEK